MPGSLANIPCCDAAGRVASTVMPYVPKAQDGLAGFVDHVIVASLVSVGMAALVDRTFGSALK
jgi:hypothetical protein